MHCHLGWLIRLLLRFTRFARSAFLGQLLLNRELAVTILLASGSGISDGQHVMRSRVPRLQLDSSFERRDRLGELLYRYQASTPSDKGIAKPSVQLGRAREVLDGLIALLILFCHLSQDIFGSRIGRIDLEFLLHLFF